MTRNQGGDRSDAVPAGSGAGPAGTSSLLRELLSRDGPYRRRWRSEVRRASASDPHQSAVAVVLAQHLWDTGEVAESDADLPRRLKDVVARAVSDHGISHQTLSWFIGAFEMTEEDELSLWRQLEADHRAEGGHTGRWHGGAPAFDPVVRPEPPAAAAIRPHEARAVPPQEQRTRAGYRTVSLLERFEIGAERSRGRRTLVHTIRAETMLDHVTYRFETPDVCVEVARGGTAGPLVPDFTPGMFAVDVEFPTSLEPGQTTTMETIANYLPGGPIVRDCRRGLPATAGGVSLDLRFHAAALPHRVRWSESTSDDPTARTTLPVELAADHGVRRFVAPDRDCTVGFEWDW